MTPTPSFEERHDKDFVVMFFFSSFKDFIYLLLERRRRGEREGEKHQCVMPLARPQLETWPATQACALTENRTRDLLVRRPVLGPLNRTSQGCGHVLKSP